MLVPTPLRKIRKTFTRAKVSAYAEYYRTLKPHIVYFNRCKQA